MVRHLSSFTAPVCETACQRTRGPESTAVFKRRLKSVLSLNHSLSAIKIKFTIIIIKSTTQ